MNDHDWQTETDPLVLLDELHPLHSQGTPQHQTRKCRLYLTACARRHWHRLPGACRGLVELAEHYTEAREREQLRAAVAPVAEQLMHSAGAEDDLALAGAALGHLTLTAHADCRERLLRGFAGGIAGTDPSMSADEWRGLAALVYLPFVPTTPPFVWVPRALHSADLIREIYYNPNAFPEFKSAWRTADVRAIARQVYDSGDFGAMPILADALQDAGCDDDDILGHLRDTPPSAHVRGCRVLDKVLDRG